MAAKSGITADYIRSRLDYDPETGVFTWRAKPIVTRHDKMQNTRYAGKQAGKPDSHGYLQIMLDRQLILAHRLAWLHHYGEWPEGELDHINRNPLDNRISNLRPASRSQNTINRKTPRTNTS